MHASAFRVLVLDFFFWLGCLCFGLGFFLKEKDQPVKLYLSGTTVFFTNFSFRQVETGNNHTEIAFLNMDMKLFGKTALKSNIYFLVFNRL